MQAVAQGVKHHPPTVGHAPAKIDGGGLGEIAGRTAHFPKFMALMGNLEDDLVVENEIIGISVVINPPQHIGTESPVAGVVFRQFQAHQEVLKGGKHTIKNVFVARHATLECARAQNSGGKNNRVEARIDEVDHGRDQLRGVLVVGVQHHYDISPPIEGGVEAGLLISPISTVAGMLHHAVDSQSTGQSRGLVARSIISEDDLVDQWAWNAPVGLFECSFCVVGRHDDHHFFVSYHQFWSFEVRKYQF